MPVWTGEMLSAPLAQTFIRVSIFTALSLPGIVTLICLASEQPGVAATAIGDQLITTDAWPPGARVTSEAVSEAGTAPPPVVTLVGRSLPFSSASWTVTEPLTVHSVFDWLVKTNTPVWVVPLSPLLDWSPTSCLPLQIPPLTGLAPLVVGTTVVISAPDLGTVVPEAVSLESEPPDTTSTTTTAAATSTATTTPIRIRRRRVAAWRRAERSVVGSFMGHELATRDRLRHIARACPADAKRGPLRAPSTLTCS